MPIISKMTHKLNTIPIEIPGEQTFFGGFPGGTSGKESAYKAEDIRDAGSTPGSGRSLGGGHSNPVRYSCLEKPMDRGAW